MGIIRQVVEARAELLQQLDSHPDRSTIMIDYQCKAMFSHPYRSIMINHHCKAMFRWFRSDLEPLYKEAVGEVAAFVGAQPDNIVIIMITMVLMTMIIMMIMMIMIIMIRVMIMWIKVITVRSPTSLTHCTMAKFQWEM